MTKQKASPLLILISAPSGGGKTTLCRQLIRARRNMVRAITCTTRPPRKGERNGVDYYFLKAEDFLKRVQAGNFLEHATVYGHSYGLLKSELLGKLRAGQGCLAERGRAGSRHHLQKGGRGAGIEAGLDNNFFDADIPGGSRGAVEPARRGLARGDWAAGGDGETRNRAMAEFRLSSNQWQQTGRPAPDAGNYRSRENAGGAVASAGF